ncbi:helix-turn-helix transcriptional regulator [Bifidobacterium indicum]|uniref:helix-turn-helix transcriptional regulator n=1 Tax=Bifidobacterium indicum TaxID=1691 RepID=UPI0030D6E324
MACFTVSERLSWAADKQCYIWSCLLPLFPGGLVAGIKDVAAEAGVSISTVSYVLSGKRRVSDETKLKVLEAVRLLDYRPKRGAAMLRQGGPDQVDGAEFPHAQLHRLQQLCRVLLRGCGQGASLPLQRRAAYGRKRGG